MTNYENLTLDEERALYAVRGARVARCAFEGPADGESALKEARDLRVEDCRFALRYPLWHVTGATIKRCGMEETCRAALWYSQDLTLRSCRLHGIKAMRECRNVRMEDCEVISQEFGWRCQNLAMERCELTAEYPFLFSRDLRLEGLTLHGKYSFQYVENAEIRNSVLDTKDAFWHSRNVTVYDSVIRGEYLGWYCENLRLVRCTLSGTQPLCYARGLVLEDCTMEGADFAFENSDVVAALRGEVVSVKNPRHGRIEADRIGQIILDEHRLPGADCAVVQRAQ